MPLAVRIFAWSSLLTLCAGCAELTGVDEYGVGEEPLPLPARPEQHLEKLCQTCVAERCAAERTACSQSPRCLELLDCHSRCSDPNCVFRCRETHSESLAFEDYFSCAFGPIVPGWPDSRCAVECGAMQNWQCLGNYSWDPPDAPTAVLEILPIDMVPRPRGPLSVAFGTRIASCSNLLANEPAGDQGCGNWTPVDDYGIATLRVSNERSTFAIEGGMGEAVRHYTRPAPRSGRLHLRFLPNYAGKAFGFQTGIPGFDASQGIVLFNQLDCLATLGKDIRAALTPGAENTVPFYWCSWGCLDLNVDGGSSGGGFVNVPASQKVEVSTRHTETDDPISSATVVVASGWTTVVDLYPRPQ